MKCSVCHSLFNLGPDGRCRLCRKAKTATDMGISYGKLDGKIWLRHGDQVCDDKDHILMCPVCKALFLPHTSNQIYDSNACAVKAAQAAYRKRKRTQARGAPVASARKEPTCSNSDESTGEHSTPKPSTHGDPDTTVSPNDKGKTDLPATLKKK